MKPDAPFSDEVSSEEAVEKRTKKPCRLRSPPMVAGDGSSIELAKRPRGRPSGSKNKPKQPVFITASAEPSSAMHPHLLEIPGGVDIVDCLARFSKQRKLGICVLSATGVVTNVTLRQPTPPTPAAAAAIVFQGRFEILSISATFLSPVMAAADVGISISLAGLQGQIVGGMVVGPLVTAGVVVVVAAAFANPTFHRLPVENEVSVSGGDVNGEEEQQHYYHLLHHRQPHSTAPPAELCGLAIYGSHFSPHITMPGDARAPPPPPY
ncbi:hypothetical protein IEQ34_015653 [Dendrobium chrysotoxum]|uniref:PPC domain-containing protein n=1 Tax=Dendrobium chrysotoxum TaxID=161865 RepID=A0AAV7GGR4_DENCH|nr:hypothetical protein IEQ34_015653 [Dendrobium chrysotoxum]